MCIRDRDIYDNDYDLSKLRHKVGMVFQYPEHQLFETTNFEDVCFGPKNQGLDLSLIHISQGAQTQTTDPNAAGQTQGTQPTDQNAAGQAQGTQTQQPAGQTQ